MSDPISSRQSRTPSWFFSLLLGCFLASSAIPQGYMPSQVDRFGFVLCQLELEDSSPHTEVELTGCVFSITPTGWLGPELNWPPSKAGIHGHTAYPVVAAHRTQPTSIWHQRAPPILS